MWSELPENCMTELTELTKTELETIENRNSTAPAEPKTSVSGGERAERGDWWIRLLRRLDNRRPIADTPASDGGI